MGNASSDSLGHSFKRLRLSELEQLTRSSPSTSSPKRKVASNIKTNLNHITNDYANSCNKETPVIICNDTDNGCALAAPTSRVSEIDAKNDCDVILFHRDEHYFIEQSCTTIGPQETFRNKSVNVELSDEEIIMCLRSSKISTDVSDSDIILCLKETYGNQAR